MAGRSRASSCSPDSVGATLLVVRDSRRTPMCSSSPRIAWLMADGDTPWRLAAFVKLRSSATVTNAARMLRSFLSIHESYSQALVFSTYYSRKQFGRTLEWKDRGDC